MKFRVNGQPAPQGSKRHVGGGRMVEMSKAVGPWREAVRAEAQRVLLSQSRLGLDAIGNLISIPEAGGLSVTVVFVLKRPKSHFRTGHNAGLVRESAPHFPAGRPDVDKLARAVLDGLVAGGVMADDAQVVSLNVSKVWAAAKDAPGAIIEVEAM